MSKSLYQYQVEQDVMEYIRSEIDLSEYRGQREELEEQLCDDLFIDDSVTGNGCGEYMGIFSTGEAKETVLADMETVIDALKEFCVEPEEIARKFLEQDWNYFDVTARCYVLGAAIYEALNDLEAAGAFEETV